MSPIDDLLALRQRLRLAIDQKTPCVCKNWQSMAMIYRPGTAPARVWADFYNALGHVLDDPAENTRWV